MTVEELVARIDDGVNALERIADVLENLEMHLLPDLNEETDEPTPGRTSPPLEAGRGGEGGQP